jgi:hypothetical protein
MLYMLVMVICSFSLPQYSFTGYSRGLISEFELSCAKIIQFTDNQIATHCTGTWPGNIGSLQNLNMLK